MTEPETTAVSIELQPKAIRVAQIIDDYRLVLNVGKRDGVEAGNSFLIYGLGNEITDPETGENLGALELVRGRGKVEHVQDAICTIRSTKWREVPGQRKIYRRDKPSIGVLSYFGPQVQEIEEGAQRVDEPFDEPAVGDHARRVA